jgi:hypothetical protein
LLAWAKVARPKELGGLGLFDIRKLSWVLRVRWPWLQLTKPDKPRNHFQLQVYKEVQCLFNMAVITKEGDGSNSLFWKDWWLNGRGIKDIEHAVYDLVPKRIRNKRKVKEALQNFRWIADVRGALTLAVLLEYFDMYHELEQVELHPNMPDEHIWKLSST